MAMTSPFSEFASGINNTVDTYRANPAPLQQEVRRNANKPLVDQSLIRLIAADMLKEEQKAKMNQVQLALNPRQGTVAEQTFADATAGKEQEVAMRVGLVNAQKEMNRRKIMNQMGIGGLPTSMNQRPPQQLAQQRTQPQPQPQQRPTMQAAGGGLIAFAEGSGPEAITSDVVADNEPQTYGQYFMDIGVDFASDIGEWASENPTLAAAIGYAPGIGLVKKGIKYGKAVKEKVIATYDKFLKDRGRLRKVREEKPEVAARFDRVKKPTSEKVGAAVETITKPKVAVPVIGGAGAAEFLTTPMGGGEEAKAPEEVEPEVVTDTEVDTEDKAAETAADKLFASADASAITAATKAAQDRLADIAGGLEGPTTRADAIRMDRRTARGTLVDAQGEATKAIRGGIGTLEEAYGDQTTSYGDVIKDAKERADMLAGRGEYAKSARLKEFLRALARMGQGGNLGQAVGRAYEDILTQEDVRKMRGVAADKETAALQKERADNLVTQAETLFSAESNLAQIIADNVKDLSTFDADTQELVLKATELSNATARAIQSLNVDIAKLGLEGELATIESNLERLNIAVRERVVAASEISNLIGLLDNIQGSIISYIEVGKLGATDEEKRNAIEATKPLVEDVQNLRAILSKKIGK
jgi:hypothetical protein